MSIGKHIIYPFMCLSTNTVGLLSICTSLSSQSASHRSTLGELHVEQAAGIRREAESSRGVGTPTSVQGSATQSPQYIGSYIVGIEDSLFLLY